MYHEFSIIDVAKFTQVRSNYFSGMLPLAWLCIPFFPFHFCWWEAVDGSGRYVELVTPTGWLGCIGG